MGAEIFQFQTKADDNFSIDHELWPHPSVSKGMMKMPAKSKAQQMAAGAALSAKHGEKRKSELKGASRSMVDSMSETELHRLAATKRKGKPEHVSKS
jgi:hypothetical protein